LHSAKIILYSIDFEPIEKLQHEGDWEETARILFYSLSTNIEANYEYIFNLANF